MSVSGINNQQSDLIAALLDGQMQQVDLSMKLAKANAALNLKAQEMATANEVMAMMGLGGEINLTV